LTERAPRVKPSPVHERPRKAWIPRVAAIGAILLRTATASGADATDADRARASELFREGRTLMAAQRYTEACPMLEESQRLDPGGGTLLNVALCHELQGRTATAWSDFRGALDAARRDGRADRAVAAEQHLRDLEPRLSRLTIDVPPEARVAGLSVRRDGAQVAVGDWNVGSPVDPGKHVVEVDAPGYAPWRTTVAVDGAGAPRTVRVPLLEPLSPIPASPPPATVSEPAPPPPPPSLASTGGRETNPPPERAAPDARPWQRPLAVGMGAVGVLGIGIGTVYGLQAASQWNQAEPFCAGGKCSTSQAYTSWQDSRSSASTATVAFVVGGVAAAGCVVLWLTAPSSSVRVGATPGALVARGEF
jgi:hypothetical protein